MANFLRCFRGKNGKFNGLDPEGEKYKKSMTTAAAAGRAGGYGREGRGGQDDRPVGRRGGWGRVRKRVVNFRHVLFRVQSPGTR